jgi:uncharacterized membrane protein YfcA
MMSGLTGAELAWLAAALAAAGAATGFFAGLFGVGGGAIIVPVLYEVFRIVGVPLEVRMPLCVGTSLAVIIPTSIGSYRAHFSRGAVDTAILRRWIAPVTAGVAIGAVVARYAPEGLFKAVFVVVAGSSAVRLLLGRDTWRLGEDFPKGWPTRAFGVVIGALSTLMGIGGGQLSNLFMTLYGRPIHQAIATSAGLGIIISIPGALGYVYAGWPKAAEFPTVVALQWPFALGYVSLLGAALVMPTSMIAAPLGVRLAHAMSKRRLEIAFGLFLLIVSARFAWSLIAPMLR